MTEQKDWTITKEAEVPFTRGFRTELALLLPRIGERFRGMGGPQPDGKDNGMHTAYKSN